MQGDPKKYIEGMRLLPSLYPPAFQERVKRFNKKHHDGEPTHTMPYLEEYNFHLDNMLKAHELNEDYLFEEEGFLHFRLLPKEVRDAVIYTTGEANRAGYKVRPPLKEPIYPEWMR